MRRGHVILWLLPALVLLAGCGGEETTRPTPQGGTTQDEPPPVIEPSVTGVTLEGLMDLVEPETPRTKPIVVNLWALWCDICPEEIPALVEFQKKLGDRADLIGVSMDFADNGQNEVPHADLAAAIAAVTEAAISLKISYPVLVADPGNGDAAGWYSYLEVVKEVPWTVVYDKDGIRKGAHSTFASADEAMAWFEKVTKAD